MSVDLTNIRVMSKTNFDNNVTTTSDDTLYFVEETIPVVTDTYSSTSSDAMSGKAVASAISGYVPTSRTVAGKSLTSNISLSASDVGALPSSTVIPTVTNTYSSTSSDAMSGIAVASALSGVSSYAMVITDYTA